MCVILISCPNSSLLQGLDIYLRSVAFSDCKGEECEVIR